MAGPIATREPRGLRSLFDYDPLASLREEVDDVVNRFVRNGGSWLPGFGGPSLDISESDNEIEVHADLPGLKPEEIDIQVSGNTLTIRGERKEAKEEKGTTYHRTERRVGEFSRSVSLPCDVQESKVDAQYADGVLTIKLPKSPEARTHKVKVKPK